MRTYIRLLLLMTAMSLWTMPAQGAKGHIWTDPGGGEYWAKVYVVSTNGGKSYYEWTGKNQNDAMEDFRGYESTNNATVSIENPTITYKFRYHHKQGGDFKYHSSSQEFNLKLKNETVVKIGQLATGSWDMEQTTLEYGVLTIVDHDDEWITIRFAPSKKCRTEVWEFNIENDTHYKQSKWWRSWDGKIQIHATYNKSLQFGIPAAREPKIEWSAPGVVKATVDNSWLPSTMGKEVNNYKFTSTINVAVISGGKELSKKTYSHEGTGSKTFDINVPLDADFTLVVGRWTDIAFTFNGKSVDQDPDDPQYTDYDYNNAALNVNTSFNQVTGEVRLQWDVSESVRKEGDFKVYRTTLNDNGTFKGNRVDIGSTEKNFFIDNRDRGLEYGNYYRYEVYQNKDVWGDVTLPSDPDKSGDPKPTEVRVKTMPVIPMHLVQDTTENENIKFNWAFGNIPDIENDITFKVNRMEPNGSITRSYKEVTVPRSAGTASFTDDKPADICTVYGYFLQLDLADNKVHLYSDTVNAHVLAGTTVRSVTASKGNSGNSVKLTWTAKQVGTEKTLFDIQRRYIGGSEWTSIHQVEGTSSQYSYTDENVEVGRYYEYRVVAYGNDCESGGRVINNAITALGYGQAAGVISGRVQFEDGSAVKDVRIDLSRKSDEKTRSPFYSRHITDNGDAMTWITDKKTANNMLRLDRPFTIQTWINPAAGQDGMGLFKIADYDGYQLNLIKTDDNEQYNISISAAISDSESTSATFVDANGNPATIKPNVYSHLTIRNNGNGKVDCIINGNTKNVYSFEGTLYFKEIEATGDKVNVGFFGRQNPDEGNNSFKGYADEVRLWNKALGNDEVTTTFNRILSGREDGLKLYWTFDEGLEEYAFDNSCTDGVPNDNHPVIGNNSRPTDIVPGNEQLSIYGITNDMGEYEIRGIPFSGSGTRYSVIPNMGSHDFTPSSRSAFISSSALTINNTDFTDVSSFRVRGTIRYTGTTIPVDSVSFYVDGMPCNKNDKLIITDENGEYEISVPIGKHYIEARRSGHTFVDNGRYPAGDNTTYDFTSDTNLDFSDNTLVVFAGRVTGGNTEAEKPLGYGRSIGTVGQAVIKISALDFPQCMINAIDSIDGNRREWYPNEDNVEAQSTTPDIKSYSYRAGGDIDDARYIFIQTDTVTGEFCAKVPPLRYKVESVTFPHNEEVGNDEMFSSVPAIDITNPMDSVIPDTAYTVSNNVLPLFRCNKKLLLTYRSQPVMEINQIGAKPGAFGTDTLTVQDVNYEEHQLPVYNYDESTNTVSYNYGYPIFEQGRTYEFKVKAYEPYTNYDHDSKGRLYKDVLRDSVVTFNNELGAMSKVCAVDTTIAEQGSVKRGDMLELEEGQIQLDSIGEGTYKWKAGMPSLTTPFTRSMNATMVINDQTKLWLNEGLQGIISGTIPTGNNFITAGPDYVQMVLRDPPGDASEATWGTDTISTCYTYHMRGVQQATDVGIEYHNGAEVDVATGGIGLLVFEWNELIHENSLSWQYTVNQTWDHRTYTTYTNSKSISTSSSPYYVGRDGDVFVGYSTNYIIGAADKVGLFQQPDGSWAMGLNEVVCVGENFKTHFEYSQKYIETTLFDNIKRTRNTKLTEVQSISEIPENPPVPTYYTLLRSDDPRYGSSNNDTITWGVGVAKPGFDGPSYYFRFPEGYQGGDSVQWCNEIIDKWKETLAKNEEDKLQAFTKAKYKIGNESFESGSTATTTTVTTERTQKNWTRDFMFNFVLNTKNGGLLNKVGWSFKFDVSIGYHETIGKVDEKTYETKFSYTLNDTQAGNAHTVDIFDSPMGWGPIFRTRGGQTRCPYEGETRTKYTNPPGQLLDYATMRSDNPKIVMPVTEVTNIPAGQEAQLQVSFNNESETHDTYTVATVFIDADSNPNGLQVFMDGEPLVNGTEVWMEYGVPLTKTLTFKQSDQSILNYNNVRLVLHSSCMALSPYDQKEFSLHFVPSAPPVTLTLNKTILNKKASDGNDPVVATIKDINRDFTGLKGVRLKYRFTGDDQWITAHEWLTQSKYLPEGEPDATHSLLPTDNPNITYTLDLPAIDGHYMVQAESFSIFDSKEVTNATNEIEVIRDTRGPKLLGHAYPNTGVFRPTDDIYVRFNEAIRESYLTKDGNFYITGVLNDAPVNHEVSLQLNGNGLSTDATIPLNNTDFSTSFWLKRQSGGSILTHGNEDNCFDIGVDESGKMILDVNNTKLESTEKIPADKWVFVGLNYFNETSTVDAFFTNDDKTVTLFNNVTVPAYSNSGTLTLGKGLHAALSNLSLWHQTASRAEILENKNKNFPAYTPGLIGYWKMDEGHGTVVTDYARGRNIYMPSETWNIDNTNYAAHFDGVHMLKSDISRFDARPTDSYMIELWFRGEKGANNGATLMSVTDAFAVEFGETGQLVLNTFDPDAMPSTTTDGTPHLLSNNAYNDGNWHHFALNVRRGVSAIAYVDGEPVKTIAETDIPAPAGDFLHIGSKRVMSESVEIDGHLFTGDIDELRIWSGAYDGMTIRNFRYSMADTTDASGLFAYYPMQNSHLDGAGNVITEFSPLNKLDSRSDLDVTIGLTQALTAPPIKKVPDATNINFNFTASDDEIYIDLNELPSRLHGNLINFKVKNVRDVNDNLSENITWSAIADYNTLKWTSSEKVISKPRLYTIHSSDALHNIGSEPTTFTITDVPSWLIITPTEGTIGVGETELIDFEITTGAPVGRREILVYAKNSDDIYTPLVISLNVTGNNPGWIVNANQYESTMNIVGQVLIDDKICQEVDTRIAAFVGDELRGVASPQYMRTRDAYFVNLTVYGHEGVSTPEPLTFRIYDASQGVVLTDVVTLVDNQKSTINFKPNDIVGDYGAPVLWKAGEKIEQTVSLKEGWNWISFFVNPFKPDLENVFGHNRAFKNVTSKSDGFGECDGTQWRTSLEAVKPGDMYKVRVTSDIESHVDGALINTATTPYTMYQGWNWIGSLSLYNLTLTEAFADLNPVAGDVVKSKTKVSMYNGFQWEGTLDALMPGEGYYYLSNDNRDKAFHYPNINPRQSTPALPRSGNEEPGYTPVDHHRFSDNMNVIAYMHRGSTPVDTASLAAFIDGECRGAVRATGGLYFLPIAGNASEQGKPIVLRSIIDGDDISVNEELTFLTDVVVGTTESPFDINLLKSGISDLQGNGNNGIYVTPAITTGDIVVKAGENIAQVRIFNASGAVIDRAVAGGESRLNLSLAQHPVGIYFVEVVTQSGNRAVRRVARVP